MQKSGAIFSLEHSGNRLYFSSHIVFFGHSLCLSSTSFVFDGSVHNLILPFYSRSFLCLSLLTLEQARDTEKTLSASTATLRGIEERREQYRPVAHRGALLFLTSQDLRAVNCMYQTSLSQLVSLFDKAINMAEKSHVLTRRIRNVTDTLTYSFYKYISRGLFDCDRVCFKLILILKILSAANIIDPKGLKYFLGTHISSPTSTCFDSSVYLDYSQESSHSFSDFNSPSKLISSSGSKCSATDVSRTVIDNSHMNPQNPVPYTWMSTYTWENICRLSSMKITDFESILSDIAKNEHLFKDWYQTLNAEAHPVPIIETKISKAHPVPTIESKISKSVATASSKSVFASINTEDVLQSFNK